MLYAALNLLGYEFHEDTNAYKKEELRNIKLILIGLQITSGFTTLCDNCHDEIHSGRDASISISKIKKKKEDNKINENIQNILLPYLNEIVDQKIYTDEDKNNLKTLFIAVGIRGRTIGLNTINSFLIDVNIRYKLHSMRETRRTNGYYKKTYWILKTS